MSLYSDLGISSTASDREVKDAYFRLARIYHPDRGKTNDDTVFKRVSAAYSVLGDPLERAKYDSRPRPVLPLRIISVSPRTLIRGGWIDVIHAQPCSCRCLCDFTGKTYSLLGNVRRVHKCEIKCARCVMKLYVPPNTANGSVFADSGHVRFVASVDLSQDIKLVGNKLVATVTTPLMNVLTGFSAVVDGEEVKFTREMLTGLSAKVNILVDGITYKIVFQL